MLYHASQRIILAWGLLGILSAPAHAEHLQVIARHGQRAPGDTGNFRIFGILEKSFSPAISGGNVAFGAITDQGSGIYAFIDQRLRLVADTKTEIPGTAIHFGFGLGNGSGPSISGRRVGFVGVNILEGGAIWVWEDGILTKLVDTNTPVPGGTGTFGTFGGGSGVTPAISGDNVAFSALSAQGGGIYAVIDGELRVIADTNTLLPGAAQTVTAFGFSDGVSPAISGENVVFFAKWSVGQGLYLYTNGEYRIIADTNTPKPGSTETFGSFFLNTNRRPAISGENVVFSISGGVFAYINGNLRLVTNNATPAPSGATFGTLSVGASIDGENIAFSAWEGDVGWGVFSYVGGEFRRIASVVTAVPGIPTTFFSFGILEGSSPAISGENVVFMGRPDGIYVGDGIQPLIPAVSTGALTLLVILLLAAGTAILLRRRAHEVSSR